MQTPTPQTESPYETSRKLENLIRRGTVHAVHHFGLRDKVRPGGPEADYSARPLLGIGPKERTTVLDLVQRYFSA